MSFKIKIVKVGLMTGLLILGGCSFLGGSGGGSPSNNNASGGAQSPVVGVRNFHSQVTTMMSAMGLKTLPTGTNVVALTTLASGSPAWPAQAASFSKSGGTAVNGAMIMATMQLAQPFCAAGIAAQSVGLPAAVNPVTTSLTSAALTPANQVALINALALRIWGRQATESEIGVIESSISSLLSDATKTGNSNANLTTVVTGVCVMMFGAPQAMSNVVTMTALSGS